MVKLKIVADENIPFISHYFGTSGELILKPGRSIKHEDLIDADILLVRSITPVNQALLHDTNVRFVASATSGFDHLDTQWLEQAGIAWAIAKGCNTNAVVEYVIAVIAALQLQGHLLQSRPRAGVIGVGTIGTQVAAALTLLGFEVLLCDPLRAETENFTSTALSALTDLDFITLHTPLTVSGSHPTFHLIDNNFLWQQKPGCVLLNASRGAVIDFTDLKHYSEKLLCCLDVWEHEPNIDPTILQSAYIATPHIAGYSIQSKYRGTEMIYQAALTRHILTAPVTAVPYPIHTLSFANRAVNWRDVILKIYDPLTTTTDMRATLIQNPNAFDDLRKHFNARHEFGFVNIQDVQLTVEDAELLRKLGCDLLVDYAANKRV